MPTSPRSVPEGLCCPRCTGVLVPVEENLRCQRCTTLYPFFGRIPCLVDDPALWRALWLSRLESYSSSAEQRAGDLRNEAQNVHILARTRERLLRLAAGFEGQVETIDEIFEPIQAGADLLPALAIPSRPESEAPTAVLESYESIFRDWVWGQDECDLVVSLVSALVPQDPGRVAVYGPGAGRVTADLHRRCGPRVTVALDVN